MSDFLSDKVIMSEIANGSELAFRIVYQRFANKLMHYFLKMTQNDQFQSEDLLQELFIQIHAHAAKYNPEYQLSTFIYSIANNLVKNSNRKEANRTKMLTEISVNQSVEIIDFQQFEQKHLANTIYQYAESIDPEGATLLYLKYNEEFQLSEIAVIVNMPLGTVKSKLHYLTKKISEKFNVNDHGK